MPPRNPGPIKEGPTFEQAKPQKRPARYVVEIRDAAGTSLLLTSANWTDSERDQALLARSAACRHEVRRSSNTPSKQARQQPDGAEREGAA
jgi:hypothetical protein